MLDEAAVRQAVSHANLPALLMMLVQMTGDLRWLEAPFHPKPVIGKNDEINAGLSADAQSATRAAAAAAIMAWQSGTPYAIAQPSPELMQRMLDAFFGEPIAPEYVPWALSLLPGAPRPPIFPPPGEVRVLIIGAGVSGLCAASRLQQQGIAYVLVEKNAGVGGTWFNNCYPGCGVDTPNHHYSLSHVENDWTRHFCNGSELRAYLEKVADECGIRSNIRFETEAVRNVYDSAARMWVTTLRRPDGSLETLRTAIVITAVGLFNPPKFPDIPGIGQFQGPVLHTGSWPREGLDTAGKRVGVIGNGASAMQLVPALAEQGALLQVFQRSPQWAGPLAEVFRGEVPAPLRALLNAVPLYRRWYRLRLAWLFDDRTFPLTQIDRDWPHPDRSLNPRNEAMREQLTAYICSQIGDRPDLLEKALPKYPPYTKRMLLDHGWFTALRKDNVALVTDPIARIDAGGVMLATGRHVPCDIIVFATGFDVTRFLSSLAVHGRDGKPLSEVWGDNGRAYMGCLVPGLPNFICLYGPNTQPAHGGSLIAAIEAQMNYVMDLLTQVFGSGHASFEVRAEVLERQYEQYDLAQASTSWSYQGVNTYHRNSLGRVVVSMPTRVIDYWHKSRRASLEEFHLERA